MLGCRRGKRKKDFRVECRQKLIAAKPGFAYRVAPTFVVRAGYGITYDPFSLQRPLRTNYPILLIQNITAPSSFTWAGRLADGLPAVQVPALGNGVLDIPGTFAVKIGRASCRERE